MRISLLQVIEFCAIVLLHMFPKLDWFLSGVSISSKKQGFQFRSKGCLQSHPSSSKRNHHPTTTTTAVRHLITIHNNINNYNNNNNNDNNDKNHRNEVLIFFIWPWAFLCGLRPRLIFAFGGVGGLAVGLAARNVVGNLIVPWWKLANV